MMNSRVYELPEVLGTEKVIHRFLASITSINIDEVQVSWCSDYLLFRLGAFQTIQTQLPIRDYRLESLFIYSSERTNEIRQDLNPDPHGWGQLAPALTAVLEALISEMNREIGYSIDIPREALEAFTDPVENQDDVFLIPDLLSRAILAPAVVEIVEVEMTDGYKAYYLKLFSEPDFICPEIEPVYLDTITFEEGTAAVLFNEALWYWEQKYFEDGVQMKSILAITSDDHRLVVQMDNDLTSSDRRYAYLVNAGTAQCFESDEIEQMSGWLAENGFDRAMFL